MSSEGVIPAKPTLETLVSSIQSYFPDADVGVVEKAYHFAQSHHKQQKRHSGEPYIIHPLSVSHILASMRMDLATIVTGILHDVVEDTAVSLEEVSKEFGQEVAQLVDGVTKISQLNIKSTQEKQAENFRKMLLAMSKDLRVIIVKLADRVHNMRTLQYLPTEKQGAIAQETLDIYAPIANRLGISWMKIELEDWSLRYLKPEVYYKLARLISQKKKERDDYTTKMTQMLLDKFTEHGLKVTVSGRSKHFYSIYKKMESRNLDFEEIHDIVGFRVLTQSLAECYEVLGIIHSFFKPVPGRFKDYIAMPKNNMYQSLHTTVIGPFGERLEMQIRTDEMHKIAESGIAAHWQYKEGRLANKSVEKFSWLRHLLEQQESLHDPREFIETVKLDLFEEDVYVFTPNGELIELPYGATPLDFAYAIHTELGHRCVGAKINGRIQPLKATLKSGDTIEILSSPTQKPSKDWLKIVKTGRARSKIRAFIKLEERDRAKVIGRELLEKEFKRHNDTLAKFEKSKELSNMIAKISYANYEDLLVEVGYGNVSPEKIFEKLFPDSKPIAPEGKKTLLSEFISNAKKKLQASPTKSPIRIAGIDDMLIRMAKCCNPLPGDDIVGYILRGRGVSIHRANCAKVAEYDEKRKVDVSWTSKEGDGSLRPVKIRIVCQDEQGLLNDMSRAISAQGVNIRSLNIKVGTNRKAIGVFDLEVRNKMQLQACIRDLEALTGIISVEQVNAKDEEEAPPSS